MTGNSTVSQIDQIITEHNIITPANSNLQLYLDPVHRTSALFDYIYLEQSVDVFSVAVFKSVS